MGFLINEEKYINENVFLHEKRISTQVGRFLDKSPTYVTYYHINSIESTTDNGFQNTERILGANSSIRFNEIKKFPIYGIEQITIDLDMDDAGLDGTYDNGEAVILPNTVKPLPNDFFIIEYLSHKIIFMVTEVHYDTLKSNNYYKINFSLKSTSEDRVKDLERQTTDKFTCMSENIGSEDNAIIRDDIVGIMVEFEKAYRYLVESYTNIFYNKKYNVLLFEREDGLKVYDRYLTNFINENKLLGFKADYKTIRLSDEDPSNRFSMEYRNTIYRACEEQDRGLMKPLKYYAGYTNNPEAIFSLYQDDKVRSVNFIKGDDLQILGDFYVPETLFNQIMSPPQPPDAGTVSIQYSDTNNSEDVVVTDPVATETTEESLVDTDVSTLVTEEPITIESSASVEDPDTGDVIFDPLTYVDEVEPAPPVIQDDAMIGSAQAPINEDPSASEPNETDMEKPITALTNIIIINSDTPYVPQPVVYDSVLNDFIINYLDHKDKTAFELQTEELMLYAKNMDYTFDSYITVPVLLFVLKKYYEKIAH